MRKTRGAQHSRCHRGCFKADSYAKHNNTLNDGRIIEHGPGFILSFIEQPEAGQYDDLTVDFGAGCTPLLAPSTFFRGGVHFIDWVDRKFTLDSVAS